MKKVKPYLCMAVFAAICIATYIFVHQFTQASSESTGRWVELDSFMYRDPDGNQIPLNLDNVENGSVTPETKGEYILTANTGAVSRQDQLLLTLNDAKIKLQIDGNAVDIRASEKLSESTDRLHGTRISIPLSASSAGHEIRLTCHYNSLDSYIFPPGLQIVSEMEKDRALASYINYNTFPAGMSCLLFLLVSGVFLLGIAMGRPDYSLIAVCIALVLHMTSALSLTGTGPSILMLTNSIGPLIIRLCIVLALLVYIIMNRKKKVFHFILCINLILLVVMIFYIFVGMQNSMPEENVILVASFSSFLSQTTLEYLLSLLINYLVFFCGGTAMISHVYTLFRVMQETQILKEKNQLISNGYEAIVSNYRNSSQIRHEWKNDLLSLHVMYKQGKYEDLGKYLEKRSEQLTKMNSVQFTQNFLVDMILQNTSRKASANSIRFQARCLLPDQLPVKDEDICSLLMNMLDNAVDACLRMDSGADRFIDFRAEYKNGFLAVRCRNSFNPHTLRFSDEGDFLTSKKDSMSHGFGVHQMELVVAKYKSLLDISHENGIFTVRTALQLT